MIGKPGNAESCSGSADSQRDMRPLHAGAHRGGFIKTEQAVNIVDQHVEVFQEVLPEDASYVEIDAVQILEFIYEHILVGDGVGAGFEQVDRNVRGRLARSGAGDHRCAPRLQMKLGGQGGVNQRDLAFRYPGESCKAPHG